MRWVGRGGEGVWEVMSCDKESGTGTGIYLDTGIDRLNSESIEDFRVTVQSMGDAEARRVIRLRER